MCNIIVSSNCVTMCLRCVLYDVTGDEDVLSDGYAEYVSPRKRDDDGSNRAQTRRSTIGKLFEKLSLRRLTRASLFSRGGDGGGDENGDTDVKVAPESPKTSRSGATATSSLARARKLSRRQKEESELNDKASTLVDLSTATEVEPMRGDGHGQAVLCGALDEGRKLLVTGSRDRLVKCWNLEVSVCLWVVFVVCQVLAYSHSNCVC